jgi:hypothetical protein
VKNIFILERGTRLGGIGVQILIDGVPGAKKA